MRRLSKIRPKQLAWQGVAAASGTLAAMAVRRAAVTTWRTTKHEDPPENPVARDVSWPDAVTWAIAVAIGAAGGVRGCATRRGRPRGKRAIGEPIPVPTDAS